MGRIKRKARGKRIVRKTKPQAQNNIVSEDQLSSLPQHLLDKIPAQMSLKPSAQSLRAMMLQRISQPYVPMPIVPQQQQLQNLKNSNDLKEQALNQIKQDTIVERDRERDIMVQQNEAKREVKRRKHQMKLEEQQMQNEEYIDEQLKKLEVQKRTLEFNKAIHSGQSQIMQGKHDLETQKALYEQSKVEHEKLKAQYQSDETNQKIEQYRKKVRDLEVENEAIQQALSKMNSEAQINEMRSLIEKITLNQSKNMILKKVNDLHNQALEERLAAECRIPFEMYDELIDRKREEIAIAQKELVTQLENNENLKIQQQRYEYMRNKLAQEYIKNEELQFENAELSQRGESTNTPKKRQKINEAISKNAKQKVENEQLEETNELVKERQKSENEYHKTKTEMALRNTPEYQQHLQEQQKIEESTVKLKHQTELNREAIKKMDNLKKARAEEYVSGHVRHLTANNQDVTEGLENLLPQAEEGLSADDGARLGAAVAEQLIAQKQTANQENEEATRIINKFRAALNAQGEEQARAEAFIRLKVKDGGTFEDLTGHDTNVLLNLEKEFDQFKYDPEAVEDEPTPNYGLSDPND